MKMTRLLVVVLTLLLYGLGSSAAGEWRFPLGVTYTSGIDDIVQQYEDNIEAEGTNTDSVDGFPFGLSLQPYYEYRSGFGIGIGIGPVMAIVGDADFFNLPLDVCLRYALMPSSDTSVYFRAGIASNLASGDYIEGSQIGFLGAVGVEFMRNRAVSVGIEIGYNSASIELEDLTTANPNDTQDIEPIGLTASVYAVF